MCGIVGIVRSDGAPADAQVLIRMRDTLWHRGPDDAGAYISGSVGLGHRRLSIIDLSPKAREPLCDESGRVWLVFNGEIYNFRELRAFLKSKGHTFRSEGDAEVVVHLYEEMGADCVERLRGMFAFAIWDQGAQSLFLARDRLGKKPLYYATLPDAFVFASEIKAIRAYAGLQLSLDSRALHHYLALQYVPSPLSAFHGVARLPAAHTLTWLAGHGEPRRYWRLRYTNKLTLDEERAAELVRVHLDEAVKIRLYADVPLGIHLSGGIDSSAVAALACRELGKGVKTFSVGFLDRGYDERPYARLVAERLGTEHHEHVVGPEAVRELPRLAWHYDQPFADPSALPTFALCRLTREHVTVALNGDGGDENFAGYDRYRERLGFALFDRLPEALRRGLVAAASRLAVRAMARDPIQRLGRFLRYASEPRARRYSRGLCHFTPEQLDQLYSDDFRALTASWDPLEPVLNLFGTVDADSFLDKLMGVDALSYLPDDLLVKVDVASMAHGLEVRSPLLDHVFMEFAARLPETYKLRNGTSKYLLKKALAGVVPQEILNRPKAGFGVPLSPWFRGSLRPFIYEVLSDNSVRRRGYFKPGMVRQLLDEHVSGRRDWGVQIWNLLMCELTLLEAGL